MSAPVNKKKVLIQRIVIALVAILIIAALGYGLKKLFSGSAPTKKAVSTIKLIPDTPPPPPPPPPPPKEQPKDEPKEVKQEPPKQQEAPQPAEALKMEGAAGDGPSPFGAGAVNNEYKGGNADTGKIGGTASKSRFAWFTAGIKSHIEEALAKDKKLAGGKYSVIIHLWVENDGSFKKFELAGSSGDPDTDARIKAALATMQPLADSPPDDMPQPVKMRVTARSAG